MADPLRSDDDVATQTLCNDNTMTTTRAQSAQAMAPTSPRGADGSGGPSVGHDDDEDEPQLDPPGTQ